MNLCRYIPYKRFEEMVLSSKLTLVAPLEVWEDKNEGYIYRALKTKEGLERIQEYTLKYSGDRDEVANVLNASIKYVRCQSWSQNYDSMVMWNAYSYNNNAIMIKTTKEKIEDLNLRVEDIVYVSNNFTLEEELNKVVDEKGITIHNVFMTKRQKFSFERETRVFQKPTGETDIPIFEQIPIRDIREFIEEVIVHPRAEDVYVKKVKTFCSDNNIKFKGKSKQLEFKLNL